MVVRGFPGPEPAGLGPGSLSPGEEGLDPDYTRTADTHTHTDPPRTHNTYTDIDTETNRHTQTYPPTHTHTDTQLRDWTCVTAPLTSVSSSAERGCPWPPPAHCPGHKPRARRLGAAGTGCFLTDGWAQGGRPRTDRWPCPGGFRVPPASPTIFCGNTARLFGYYSGNNCITAQLENRKLKREKRATAHDGTATPRSWRLGRSSQDCARCWGPCRSHPGSRLPLFNG